MASPLRKAEVPVIVSIRALAAHCEGEFISQEKGDGPWVNRAVILYKQQRFKRSQAAHGVVARGMLVCLVLLNM